MRSLDRAGRTGRLRTAFAALALATLGWAVYINSLTNPFVYDDFRLIVENRALDRPGDLAGVLWHDVSRPIVNLSYALDAAVWGLRPLGFHLTNVLLHAINVLLVFACARAVAADGSSRARSAAADLAEHDSSDSLSLTTAVLAAAVFAVHPALSQAVGYISARSELLCATFLLGAFLAARRFLNGGTPLSALAALAAWLMALGAKEVAAMFPFVVIAYDALILRARVSRSRRAALYTPMLAIVAAAAALRIWLLGRVEYGDTAFDGRLVLVALDGVRGYLQLLAWPAGQTIFHALQPIDTVFAPRAMLVIGTLAGAAALGWWLRRVSVLAPWGLAWFALFLVPSSALFVLGRGEALAEHRVYVAAIGVFLAGASVTSVMLARARVEAPMVRWALIAVLAVGTLQLGMRTIVRNSVWSDPVGLWQESVRKAPDHWLPHLMLGEALRVREGCGPAASEYRMAMRLRPEEVFPYTKLGGCLVDARRLDEAEQVFLALRDAVPTSAEGPTGLAIVAMLKGSPLYSRMHLQEALVRDPAAVLPRQLLARLEEPRDPSVALRLCQEIRQLAPNTPGNEECIARNQPRVQEGASPSPDARPPSGPESRAPSPSPGR